MTNTNQNESHFETCRFCESKKMRLIMDFGKVALAGGFLVPEQFDKEPKFPMRAMFCEDCYLLQIPDRVPPALLFKDYFYFSSAITTLKTHFREYAKEVTDRFLRPENATVVEIGCNDGVLANPFADQGIKNVIGVDPATNVVKSVNNPKVKIVNDFFTEKTAEAIKQEYGPADLIVANNVYAHIDDMHDVTRGIERLLALDGVFIFEVHYIKNLLEEFQYDMIYHEHLYYYSLLALDNFLSRFGLEVFDVKPIAIHAGSMRYYVRRKGHLRAEKISDAVIKLRKTETEKGYDKVETYLNYASEIAKTRVSLMKLLNGIKAKGENVFGYGASGRANTIIQYCGIDNKTLSCIIDDAPAKHGFYTPGSHILIQPRDKILAEKPNYILVFAWSFIKEIVGKNMEYLEKGGKFIVPLPQVRIISMKNGEILWHTPEEMGY